MKTPLTALFLGLMALPGATYGADDTHSAVWFADYDEAVVAAKKQDKDLLVDFTGSDWCKWCIHLDKEVFEHEEFLTAAQENYILVALDFPSGEEVKAKVPNPERNAELSEKYQVSGFPTVLLTTPEGEVFARTGYLAGGPTAYIEHMTQIATSGKKTMMEVKQVVAEFKAASGEAKIAVWEKVAKSFEKLDTDSPFATQLADALRWAMTFDADNAKGLKKRTVEVLIDKGIFDEAIFKAGMELDPKNESGLYEKVIGMHFDEVRDEASSKTALETLDKLTPFGIKNTELAFSLYFRAAVWCQGPLAGSAQDDAEAAAAWTEKAKKYARVAKDIGIENERAIEELDKILND